MKRTDVNPSMNLSNKKFNWLIIIAVFVSASIIACYFRLYPLRDFKTDDAKEKATVYVISQLQKQAAMQVKMTHPKKTASEQQVLSKKLFNKLLSDEKENVKIQIDKLANTINASTQSDKKNPYLLASDSFYYYNLSENILKEGHLSDTLKGSKYLNKLMLAPTGHWEPLNLHPFVGVLVYKTAKLFNKNIDLMFGVGFTPLLITLLSLIAFCGIGRNLKCHPAAIFSGLVFLSLAPIFIRRSTFGWYDNDPYNTFFPLLIFWILFACIDAIVKHDNKNNKNFTQIALSICALFISLLVYSVFWHGWMVLFTIIVASFTAITLYSLVILRNGKLVKLFSFSLLLFCLGSFTTIGIAFGFDQFFTLFKEGWIALKNFLTPQLAIWPDLYISVGELHSSSFKDIIETTGGKLPTGIAILGLLSLHPLFI